MQPAADMLNEIRTRFLFDALTSAPDSPLLRAWEAYYSALGTHVENRTLELLSLHPESIPEFIEGFRSWYEQQVRPTVHVSFELAPYDQTRLVNSALLESLLRDLSSEFQAHRRLEWLILDFPVALESVARALQQDGHRSRVRKVPAGI
jgi:hypothetical protein